jgi:glutamine synthetase
MAKPFQDDFGSAAHVNISLADKESEHNVFEAENGEYSDISRHFVAGVLAHAGAICAVTSPTVNSYKRFTSKGFMDEISWAPVYRAWGENNRTLMCRMPVNRHCLEVRTVDASVNYHLGIGLILAAGLEGVVNNLDPGPPLNQDAYRMTTEDLSTYGQLALPRSLDEALDELEVDSLAQAALGKEFHQTFLDHKRAECREYGAVVTDWESRTYLQRL